MKKMFALAIVFVLGLALSQVAFAHSPLLSCWDNGDGTITCEGGFSDGSSASGVQMFVKDPAGKVLLKGAMSPDSEFSFDKPKGDYVVEFNAGEGHTVQVPGSEIFE
jgi:hypothetical protein